MLRRVLNSYLFLWLLLSLPGIVTLVRYMVGDTFYGEVVHFTGQFSTQLLIITMAATPLRLMYPGHQLVQWLVRQRRYFGVAAFGYAALHTSVYLARTGVLGDILSDAIEPGLLTGWFAFAIFIPLAMTSNHQSVRKFGRWWKLIHRWVYLAAVLTFAHWLLVAFDPVPGVFHLLFLAVLETVRVLLARSRRNTCP